MLRRLPGGYKPVGAYQTTFGRMFARLPALAQPGPGLTEALMDLGRPSPWSMPSGQAIARSMGALPLASADLSELSAYGLGLEKGTPLFYYVLKEAELFNDGLFLGRWAGTS